MESWNSRKKSQNDLESSEWCWKIECPDEDVKQLYVEEEVKLRFYGQK